MLDVFAHLGTGFAEALTPTNLLYAFAGVLIGQITGVLPGLGPTVAIALLIPLSFGLDPVQGLILLSGIYYGSQYGGSITSILIRTPGELSSVVTTIDGYEMTKRGRAGAALATAAIGSFIAGTLSTFLLMMFAQVMVVVATSLGATEYALLILLALMMTSNLTGGSRLKSLVSLSFGLGLGMVGLDPQANVPRETFGILELSDGIEFVIVAMALFAIPEALENLAGRVRETYPDVKSHGRAKMSREDWRRSTGPWIRGSFLGFLVGVLPGIGPLGSFFSYPLEKRLSKHKHEFGKGAIEGVAGPEAANNAGVGGGMVPLFTLGIPGSPTLALLLFVFTMYGLEPGPELFQGSNSTIVWAIIASMYIGNVMLLILNLPLVGLFEKLLKIPHVLLFPSVLSFVVLGSYATSFNLFSMGMVLLFGIVGYLMQRADIPLAPAVLGLVLEPQLEQALRRSLQISQGSLGTFFDGPVPSVLTIIVLAVIIVPPLLNLLPKKSPAVVAIADPSGAAAHAVEPELVGRDGRFLAHGEHAQAEQTEALQDDPGGPPRTGP